MNAVAGCWQRIAAAVLAQLALAAPGGAACLTDLQVAQRAAQYMNREVAPNPVALDAQDGACTRTKFNRFLAQQLGAPVGYKAGLTNPDVQKRFNHDAPVRGTLYAPMLLPNGAVLDARFGARPLFEADLLVRVRDTGIQRARTPQDVLRHIDQVIPFIELPDLMVEAPTKLDGPALMAINVGARFGVMGTPIAVTANAEFSRALRDMQVVLKSDGVETDRGKGSDVLGHPLNAVIWLAQDLAREGLALRRGDLVSLGSFSRLLPPKPGLRVQAVYQGLPGSPVVDVSFK